MTTALLVGAFLMGAALGAAHFYSLWGSVALIGQGRTALGIALQALRFGLIAIALVLVARAGAGLLVAAAAGLIVTRLILTRHERRRA